MKQLLQKLMKISSFYCNQRGLNQEEAVKLIVNGFCKDVLQQLPMEFAVESSKTCRHQFRGERRLMLEIKNLNASINDKEILKDLNISIKPGELHAIMGPNGSGKSTLANVLSGKDGYKISGELNYLGKVLTKYQLMKELKREFS